MSKSQWLEKPDVFMKELADFRQRNVTRLQEWKNEKRCCDNGLVAALEAVLAKIEILSNLLASPDGAEESVPISELRARFRELKTTAKVLVSQWEALER